METVIRRELAKPSPRHRLVPIINVIEAVSSISGGRAAIPEICDMLTKCFDIDKMMIYLGPGYGLAEPIDGFCFDDYSDYNRRGAILVEFFNSQYWMRPNARIFTNGEPLGVGDFLMAKSDGKTLAQRLWDAIINFGTHEHERFPSESYENWRGFSTSTEIVPATQDSEAKETQKPVQDNLPSDTCRWPWGNHHTEALGHLEAAAKRWWVNYDPDDSSTAPLNQDVIDWLIKEHKTTEARAKSIASILRVDGLPSGPRR